MGEGEVGAVAVAEVDVVEKLIPTTTRIGMAFNGTTDMLQYPSIDRAFESSRSRSRF